MEKAEGNIVIVPHDSDHYWQAVYLRNEVLRIPLGLTFTKEELDAEYDQIHFVYLENQRVKGCLALKPVDDAIMKMRQVAVHPDLQGYGIGKKLVLFSEEYTRKKGFTTMTCHARKTAVPFYEKLDYEIEEEEFTEVNIPHFKMVKIL